MAKTDAEPAATPAEPEVDLLGHLTVQLDAEYRLRPSRLAITNIEHATGKVLAVLAGQCSSLLLPVDDLGTCVAELMKAYGAFDPTAGTAYKAPNAERLADLIFECGAGVVALRLAKIFREALTGGYTASGEPKAVGTKTTEPTPTAD